MQPEHMKATWPSFASGSTAGPPRLAGSCTTGSCNTPPKRPLIYHQMLVSLQPKTVPPAGVLGPRSQQSYLDQQPIDRPCRSATSLE
jgi:hypothetical protein